MLLSSVIPVLNNAEILSLLLTRLRESLQNLDRPQVKIGA